LSNLIIGKGRIIFQTVSGRGADVKLVVFYITIAREIIGNIVSEHVNVSTLTSNLDIVTDFIVFSLVILH